MYRCLAYKQAELRWCARGGGVRGCGGIGLGSRTGRKRRKIISGGVNEIPKERAGHPVGASELPSRHPRHAARRRSPPPSPLTFPLALFLSRRPPSSRVVLALGIASSLSSSHRNFPLYNTLHHRCPSDLRNSSRFSLRASRMLRAFLFYLFFVFFFISPSARRPRGGTSLTRDTELRSIGSFIFYSIKPHTVERKRRKEAMKLREINASLWAKKNNRSAVECLKLCRIG